MLLSHATSYNKLESFISAMLAFVYDIVQELKS